MLMFFSGQIYGSKVKHSRTLGSQQFFGLNIEADSDTRIRKTLIQSLISHWEDIGYLPTGYMSL